LGQAICLATPEDLGNLPIHLELQRQDATIFAGETTTSKMKRTPGELVAYLTRELDFPQGVFLMTGTGVVPGDEFSLMPADRVRIQVGSVAIENPVLTGDIDKIGLLK
jgi:2-dehydro-3-deoxy-D-arabinonate dehydratase